MVVLRFGISHAETDQAVKRSDSFIGIVSDMSAWWISKKCLDIGVPLGWGSR